MRIQVLCVIAAVVLSGCMGGGDTPPLTETSSSSPGGGNPNTGAPCTEDCGPTGVRGRVVDREDLPVADVQVGLLETPFESLTTGAGEYEIENVPPGVYQIAFDRIGYDPEVRTVSVEDGEMTKVDVTLTSRASTKPYDDTEIYDATIVLGHALLDIVTGTMGLPVCDSCQMETNVTYDAQTILLEVYFEATIANPAGPTQLGYQFWNGTEWAKAEQGDLSAMPMAAGEWASRGQVRVDHAFAPGEEFRLVNYCDLEWVCIDQDFSVFVTTFYGAPMPAEFTALPEE